MNKTSLMNLGPLSALMLFFPSPSYPVTHSLEGFADRAKLADFRVTAQYTNHEDQVMGARLLHEPSGAIAHLLQIETVPQAAISIRTHAQSANGAAHALEHLLVGKGTEGRALGLLSAMRLSTTGAGTAEKYTYYGVSSSSGMESFYELFEQELKALFQPDFSDEEARREVYHFGVTADRASGKLSLAEKGTVYTEIQSNPGYYDYWYGLMSLAMGEKHPLGFPGGGAPDAMRSLSVEEIREFHQKHYVLGPSTPLIFVIDRKQDPFSYLTRISAILKPFTPERKATSSHPEIEALITPKPQEKPELRLLPFPSQNSTDPSNILLGWKPVSIPSLRDRLLLETFLHVLGSDTQSNLYRSLVDSQTRELDWGGTGPSGVGTLSYATYSPTLPLTLLWVSGVQGHQVDKGKLEDLRDHVLTKIQEVANFQERSEKLLDFNRRAASYLSARMRALKVWHASPPHLGERRNDTDWVAHMDTLESLDGFKKSLVFKEDLEALLSEVDAGKNPWNRIIQLAGLLDPPYGTASIPSPGLLEDLRQKRKERLASKLSELKQRYRLQNEPPSEQQALSRFQAELADEEKRLAQAKGKVRSIRFTAHPPMSYDDSIQYSELKVAGTRTVTTLFEGASRTDLGLAFDLRSVPKSLYRYLPILPSLIRSTGLKEDGRVTPYHELDERILRDIYAFRAHLSANPQAKRYELRLTASGADAHEFKIALHYLNRVTHSNHLDSSNLSRIKDLVDQAIRSEDAFTKQPEEDWIEDLATAFRFQRDHLYWSMSSSPARVHELYRLQWMLQGPVRNEEVEELARFSKETLEKLRAQPPSNLAQELSRLPEKGFEKGFKNTGLKEKLLGYWNARLSELPPSEALDGLALLSEQVFADLKKGPEAAIADLRDLQKIVLNRAKLSAYFVGDQTTWRSSRKDIESLFQSFPSRKTKNVSELGAPLVSRRISPRNPSFKDQFPYFVGYVHEDSVNGNIVNSAKIPDFTASSQKDLIDALSVNLLSGGGPHSLFMKTWEAGLAYSNGIRAQPRSGLLSYYADRCPRARDTLEFVRARSEDLSAFQGDEHVDYLLSQAFASSRANQSFSARGEALATDLSEGVTPRKVRTYSLRLLALRKAPSFLSELKRSLPRVINRVMPGRGDAKDKAQAQSIFFLIAPEKQLQELEGETPEKRLPRVWRSDFWLE